MIKRTNSFEVQKKQGENGNSGDFIRQGHEGQQQRDRMPQSIHPRQISGIKISQKANTHKQLSARGSKKIPDALLALIITNATGKKPQMGKSKFGNNLMSKFKTIRKINFTCGICQMEYKSEQKTKIGDTCEHFFCDSCLQHYVIYKVGMFEEVVCPNEQCNLVLNPESKFFANLPGDIQKKYVKLHAFYVTSKDPNLKLCPSQKCEDGILKLTNDGQPLPCNKCAKVYCPKCFFQTHMGECDKNQVDFFQNNLHYRQCSGCKNVIERSAGCNHMTCRCGYEFCYVCGGKWEGYHHICPQNQGQNQNGAQQHYNQNDDDGCFGDCCDCLTDGDCCGTFVSILIKMFIGVPVFILLVCLLSLRVLLIGTLMLGVTLLVGIFPYTCEIIWDENQCPCTLFLLIFYPLVMFMGIGRAFTDFFCQMFGQEFEQYCDGVGGLCECCFQW